MLANKNEDGVQTLYASTSTRVLNYLYTKGRFYYSCHPRCTE